MKKTLLILLLIAALCLTGCSSNTTEPNTPSNATRIWEGISGDTLELAFTGRDMTAVLNKDGTAILSSLRNEYVPAGDFSDSMKDYDAEMGVFTRYYGTFKEEGDQVILTLNDQSYYCLDVRGKDAESFKEAYIALYREENPAELDSIIAAFEKGHSTSECKGTQTLKCSYDGKELKILTLQNHNKDGKLTNESVIHEDGSYTNTTYYADGAVQEVREYNTEEDLVKLTSYLADGSVEYIQQTDRTDKNNVTTTRTDANGNVLSLEENIKEEYDGGKRTIQRRTENGVLVYSQVLDERNNGLTVMIIDETQGNVVAHSFEVRGGISDTEFYLYKQTEDGKLTAYQCHRYYPETEALRYRSVFYNMDTDMFELIARYEDGGENHNGIPASDYVHGAWEDPTDYK